MKLNFNGGSDGSNGMTMYDVAGDEIFHVLGKRGRIVTKVEKIWESLILQASLLQS